MPGLDFSHELNPEQCAAACAPDGPVLVLAAAGTGKTRTLTYRVAALIDRGVPTSRILLLTFTNRAAREMLARARSLAGESVGDIWGGTFHHLANRLLRRHAGRLGYGSDYTILDQDDSVGLVRATVSELGLRDKHFPKADVLHGVFSLACNKDVPVAGLLEDHFGDSQVDIEATVRVAAGYARRKKDLNALDFDDLLTEARRLLAEHEDIRARYQEQFLHVLVDEYQDTNPIQGALVDMLAGGHRNLLVVGDDFQSIYSWRGADFRQFLTFPQRYPDVRIFKLETNYRSTPGILAVANACIAAATEQFPKTLRPVREDGVRPVCVEMSEGNQQAGIVVEEIARLIREGLPPNEIAVLYRAHYHAMELQLELTRAGIPYRMTSGVRFFEQAHIKDACALLRLVHQPADELAFLRLLSLLPRVGERSAGKVWAAIGHRFCPLVAADRARVRDKLPAAARDDWDAIAAVFAAGGEDWARAPGELVSRFSEAFYREYAMETFENADRRLDDLEQLTAFMTRYETLADFLNEITLLTNVDTAADRGDGDGERILLSTVHQAKGLEWRAVFILWLTEGMFPSLRAMEDSGGEAEERRLFYVASTRARDRLFLCVPQYRRTRDGGFQWMEPSRFIRELPETLVRRDRRRSSY